MKYGTTKGTKFYNYPIIIERVAPAARKPQYRHLSKCNTGASAAGNISNYLAKGSCQKLVSKALQISHVIVLGYCHDVSSVCRL